MTADTIFYIAIIMYPIIGLLVFLAVDAVNGNIISLARKIKLSVFWPITLFIGDIE